MPANKGKTPAKKPAAKKPTSRQKAQAKDRKVKEKAPLPKPEAVCKRCGGTTRLDGGTCPDCDPGQS